MTWNFHINEDKKIKNTNDAIEIEKDLTNFIDENDIYIMKIDDGIKKLEEYIEEKKYKVKVSVSKTTKSMLTIEIGEKNV